MNIFGDKPEKEFCPQCPCCKCKIKIMCAMSVKGNWIEYVCGDCRRTFAVIGDKIKILGWG